MAVCVLNRILIQFLVGPCPLGARCVARKNEKEGNMFVLLVLLLLLLL